MKDTINVSEIFHSIQGEGNTMGKPSVFVRLQACNLMCGGQGTEKDKELHDGATWRCDTIEVWLEGKTWTTKKLAHHLYAQYGHAFPNGTQLILTGGEPLLQQDQFPRLLQILTGLLDDELRVEIETNGTILPKKSLAPVKVNQFNVSPKLANSGMPKNRRIKPEPLEYLAGLTWDDKAIFKFVVTRQEDMQEIITDFVEPFKIPSKKIWLMPGCSNREQFEKVSPLVADACKDFGFNFSSRLQINLWNETTGV